MQNFAKILQSTKNLFWNNKKTEKENEQKQARALETKVATRVWIGPILLWASYSSWRHQISQPKPRQAEPSLVHTW